MCQLGADDDENVLINDDKSVSKLSNQRCDQMDRLAIYNNWNFPNVIKISQSRIKIVPNILKTLPKTFNILPKWWYFV